MSSISSISRPSSSFNQSSFSGQTFDCICSTLLGFGVHPKDNSAVRIDRVGKSGNGLCKRFRIESKVATDGPVSGISLDSLKAPEQKLHATMPLDKQEGQNQRSPRLLIAGGGIGGLVLALAAKNRGLNVKVFERDLSAIRGEGQYRGPIQVQSNALAALEVVDAAVAEEIMANGCITGDRINGLVDGLTGTWYVKFDTFTPAADRGLPVTRVISRMTLQEILARAVGPEIIENNSNVVDFKDDGSKVTAFLDDGRSYEGDVLIGADGIWSKVRAKLLGHQEPTYSGYTCYTGIADFIPPDIETVGYRVFLGHKQYFVSSDVGHGKMQWYAFHNEPAGGTDPPGGRKERLLKLFGDWCDGVIDLLLATPEEQILRRDIYDRVPIMTWSKGRVTLLGDSAHAMQPNMGQGGCMAIEDAYQLAIEICKSVNDSAKQKKSVDIPHVLQRYERERRLRVGAIHGMARMAAVMASTYKPYLGEGLGPLSILKKLRIPHPGRVGGRFFVNIAMPIMLSWVLGGNRALEDRIPSCRISDKASDKLKEWFANDDALERAALAEWYLVPYGERLPFEGDITETGKRIYRIGNEEGRPTIIGRLPHKSEGDGILIDNPQIAEKHAKITSSGGAFFLTDFHSDTGTWVTNVDGGRYKVPPFMPVRLHSGDVIEFGAAKKVVYRVKLRKALKETPKKFPLEAQALTTA